MRRLQAEEDLRAIRVATLGAGLLKPGDRRRAFADLEREVSVGRPRRKASLAEIESMGGVGVNSG